LHVIVKVELFSLTSHHSEVQHAGHTHPNDSVNVIISPDETTQQHRPTVYSLQDQIDHKIRLLDYLVEERYKDHRIVLVGHSVGAYIACEVLNLNFFI
jgi:surfactin synthase thioesterase subunit